MNAIIIYYSRSGNTEKIAKQLQADLGNIPAIKIEPEEAYGNYIMSCLRVMKENREKVTPAFITPIPDLSAYDTVFIGFPIWAQDVPVFVQDFIRQCDSTNKSIIPFATYGMSGISWTKKPSALYLIRSKSNFLLTVVYLRREIIKDGYLKLRNYNGKGGTYLRTFPREIFAASYQEQNEATTAFTSSGKSVK